MRQNFSNNGECFTDGKHFCSLLGSEYRLSNQQRQLFEVWNILASGGSMGMPADNRD